MLDKHYAFQVCKNRADTLKLTLRLLHINNYSRLLYYLRVEV